MKKIKNPEVINSISMAVAFLLMLFMTSLCPKITDDWHFVFVWREFYPLENDTRVMSMADIFESMRNYYMYSGGRVTCHFLVYCLINTNLWIYRILNSAVFVLLGRVMYTLIKHDRTVTSKFLLPIIYLVCFLFLPSFGDNFLWLPGALNYLWPAVLMLYCMRLIDKYFPKLTVRQALLCSLPILLSSSTNEVTGGVLIVLMTLTLAELRKKPSPVYLIPFAAAIPGILLVVLSPGNSVRAAVIEGKKLFDMSYILQSAKFYFIYFAGTFLIEIVLIIFSARIASPSKKIIPMIFDYMHTYKYLLTGAAGIMALSASSTFFVRPAIFGVIMIVIAFFRALLRILDHLKELKITKENLILYVLICLEFALLVIIRLNYEREAVWVTCVAVMLCSAFICKQIQLYLRDNAGKNKASAQHIADPRGRSLFKKCRRIFTIDNFFAAMMIIFICNVSLHTVLYRDNITHMNNTIDQLADALLDNDKDRIDQIGLDIQEYSIFFPDAARQYFRTEYTLSWMAKNYGADIDYADFDEERIPY